MQWKDYSIFNSKLMKSYIEKYLWKFLRKADSAYHRGNLSWAQQGEDLIIDFIFTWYANCKNPSYLDIGANHPFALSNTYLFYKRGCKGVNIEPDPSLINEFKKRRPRDINLNVGIGQEISILDFYLMSSPTLNTFSKKTADEYVKSKTFGYPKIKEVKKISVVTINDILRDYFSDNQPYFISIDVEGWDYEILSSIDFGLYKPILICIETNQMIKSDLDKYNLILNKSGYMQYAENSINSIFIKSEIFKMIRNDGKID